MGLKGEFIRSIFRSETAREQLHSLPYSLHECWEPVEKTDHLRAGSRPSRIRVMFLFCFPPKTQYPYFLFFSCRVRNWALQSALHPPAFTVPLSLLQSLGASRNRAFFTKIICLVSVWLYIKSAPQHGKWVLISNLLTLKDKRPYPSRARLMVGRVVRNLRGRVQGWL